MIKLKKIFWEVVWPSLVISGVGGWVLGSVINSKFGGFIGSLVFMNLFFWHNYILYKKAEVYRKKSKSVDN